jgi:hypothetical protein
MNWSDLHNNKVDPALAQDWSGLRREEKLPYIEEFEDVKHLVEAGFRREAVETRLLLPERQLHFQAQVLSEAITHTLGRFELEYNERNKISDHFERTFMADIEPEPESMHGEERNNPHEAQCESKLQ